MCFLISCCLRCIPKPPAECRRHSKAAADALLASVWGRKETSCGTKVAVCVSKTITYLLISILGVYLLRLVFFRPYQIRPTIDAAVLTAFNLDRGGDNALVYGLAMNIAFFNAHRVYSVRFDHLTAAVYYNGTRLGGDQGTQLPEERFTLRPRRRRTDPAVLSGRAANVGDVVEDEFSREQKLGQFTVDVAVKTTLTYKFWPTKAVYYYEYDCRLIFPDPAKVGDGAAHAVTDHVKCTVAK
uniref:Uncharacterized protein n=1 Tax=Avena sativa TaxID=4498 RepID=A0ACD5TCK2_AVESA